MRRAAAAWALLGAALAPLAPASAEERPSAIAGAFYPGEAAALEALVDRLLDAAPAAPDGPAPRLLLAPHAGYVFSGRTAAEAYRRVRGRRYDTVVLIGPCHRSGFAGASVWTADAWRTPLGAVPVDGETARAIRDARPEFQYTPDLHLPEHSLEAQLPFLQRALEPGFRIVPILTSRASPAMAARLAAAVLEALRGQDALVVISTDLTHYRPDEEARRRDATALVAVQQKDLKALWARIQSGSAEFCGAAAVLTGLEIARAYEAPLELLAYATSGDATGDRRSVVGYAAAALADAQAPRIGTAAVSEDGWKAEFLVLARRALVAAVQGRRPVGGQALSAEAQRPAAVFVTLRAGERLRGCIGTFERGPLDAAVVEMTESAALRDPRFPPVEPGELDGLTIEISVLGDPVRVGSADDIRLGEHGVIVRRGRRSGVFLPKVAEETGWDKERFLEELCAQKAGLEPGCWKDPATELSVFTAEDFAETR